MLKNELIRKAIHILFLGTIPLIYLTSIRITQAILIFFGVIYFFLEQARLKNKNIFLFSHISNLTIREKEKQRTAMAPITLALGIILVSELYNISAMYAAIVAATIGDSMAAVIGQIIKGKKLWWNHDKSYSGLFANFISVFAICLLWLPPKNALCAGLVSAIVESLNLEEVDNLIVPLSVGASLYFI